MRRGSPPRRGYAIGAHAILWAAGAAWWEAFIGWGNVPFWFLDWRPELSYLAPLKEALVRGVVPWHVSNGFNDTDRFLAVPVTMLAPHFVALRWLPFGAFEVLHVLVGWTAGYLGLAAIRRRHGLSWGGFGLLLALFVLNGYPAAHLSVGHVLWWTGYGLLPWFLLGVLVWIDEGPSVRLSLLLALLVFAASLVGAFHYCNWFVLFVVVLAAFRPRWLGHAAIFAAAGGLLTAYRTAPGLVAFTRNPYDLPGGFRDLAALVAGLTARRGPEAGTEVLGWWEYDMYVGWPGLALILGAGLLPLVLGARASRSRRPILVPVGALAVLSFGGLYSGIFGSVPPFSAERVTTRFLIVSLTASIVLAAIHADRFLSRLGRAWPVAWAGVGVLVADLGSQAWSWRVAEAARRLPRTMSPPVPVSALVERPDPVYVGATAAGWAVTAIALAGIGWWLWSLRGRVRPTRRSR